MKPTPEILNLIVRRTKILVAMQQTADPARHERLSSILFKITALIIGKEKARELEFLKQMHGNLKQYSDELRLNARAIIQASVEVCFWQEFSKILSEKQFEKGGVINTQTSDDWSEYVIGKLPPPPPPIPPKKPINTAA